LIGKDKFGKCFCHICNAKHLEQKPFFYICDVASCEYSDTCVDCFRKHHPDWKLIENEWRFLFHNRKTEEYDVRIYKNITSAICTFTHELINCKGYINSSSPTSLICDACRETIDQISMKEYWCCLNKTFCNLFTLCNPCYLNYYTEEMA
jgi:hypothetical protein